MIISWFKTIYLEDMRYECKLTINNKEQNAKDNINKCDCIIEFITDEFFNSGVELIDEFYMKIKQVVIFSIKINL